MKLNRTLEQEQVLSAMTMADLDDTETALWSMKYRLQGEPYRAIILRRIKNAHHHEEQFESVVVY